MSDYATLLRNLQSYVPFLKDLSRELPSADFLEKFGFQHLGADFRISPLVTVDVPVTSSRFDISAVSFQIYGDPYVINRRALLFGHPRNLLSPANYELPGYLKLPMPDETVVISVLEVFHGVVKTTDYVSQEGLRRAVFIDHTEPKIFVRIGRRVELNGLFMPSNNNDYPLSEEVSHVSSFQFPHLQPPIAEHQDAMG